jgi:hypothetical protein
MTSDSISSGALQPDVDECLFDNWFDPIESAVRDRVRSFIEELIESELETVLNHLSACARLRQRSAAYVCLARRPENVKIYARSGIRILESPRG